MSTEEIRRIQGKIGAVVDGFWGPKSIAACQKYLRSLCRLNPWPGTSQRELSAFYGVWGDESKLVNLPAPRGLLYEGRQVTTVRCHRAVADSLGRILDQLVKDFPGIAAEYAGCYNNRAMRGGSLPSLHARGAAVDFAPDHNGNHTAWPTKATMPFGVMEIFAREGWTCAGAFWGRDAMHAEATSV